MESFCLMDARGFDRSNISGGIVNSETVNIHGGIFNHIEGSYTVSQATTLPYEKGLDALLQHIAPEAMHNSGERYPPPLCHANTRKDIISELTNWIELPQQHSSIVWLHAPAGHGKSAILQTLAESLSSPMGRVVASFFFGRGKGKREQARYLFPTIAYQLALHVPGLREHIGLIMHDNPTIPTTAMKFQVESLFVKAFTAFNTKERPQFPFTIIIDGLDECSDYQDQTSIIKLVEQMTNVNRLPLRFLIASRPEPQIREVFSKPRPQGLTYQVTLSDGFRSRSDIEIFLRHGFSDIYRRKSHLLKEVNGLWPPDWAIRFLCDKSCGQFIYATTILKFIDDRFKLPGSQLDIILSHAADHKNVYSDLDSLYLQILSTYPDPDTLICLLGFIVVLPMPEPAPVFEDLLNLNTGEVQLILQGMHSLLDGIPQDGLNRNPISIPHASFRDFLIDKNRAGRYYIDINSFNSKLVTAAFSVVARSLLVTIKIPSKRPDPETLTFLSTRVGAHIERLEDMPQSVLAEIINLEAMFRDYDFRLGNPLKAAIAVLSSTILKPLCIILSKFYSKSHELRMQRSGFVEQLKDICEGYRNLVYKLYSRTLSCLNKDHPLLITPGIFVLHTTNLFADYSSNVEMLADMFSLERHLVQRYLDDLKAYHYQQYGLSLRDFLNREDMAKDLYHSEQRRHIDVCRRFILRFFGTKWSGIREPSPQLLAYLSNYSSAHFEKSGWGDDILSVLDHLEIPGFDPAGVSFNKAWCVWILIKILLGFFTRCKAYKSTSSDIFDDENRLQMIKDHIFRQIFCITKNGETQSVSVVIREPFLTIEHSEHSKAISSQHDAYKPAVIPFTTPTKSKTPVSQIMLHSHSDPLGLHEFLTDPQRAGHLHIPESASVFSIIAELEKSFISPFVADLNYGLGNTTNFRFKHRNL